MILIRSREDNFSEYIIKAIVSHGMITLLLFLGSKFLDLNFSPLNNNTKDVQVVESSVRVDVVTMPKLTLQELKKINLQDTAPQVEEAKEVTGKETSDVEFKKVSKKVNLNNLLKKFSTKAIDKPRKKKIKVDRKKFKQLILEGNKVSQGSSTTGADNRLSEEEFINYIQNLPDRVRPNWKLPSYLIDKELRCRLRVYIGADGSLLNVEIFESSTDSEFDEKALDAVRQSSPFPRPGQEILSRVTGGDVILGFPL